MAALVAGFVGALTGIGGVILVPALTHSRGMPIDVAIGTVMFALVFSAPVAALAAVRRVRLARSPVAWLCVAAAVGAIVGTATLPWFPGRLLRLLVAAAALVSGLLVGWASAVTGTGGPILLIPVLLLLGMSAPVAVGLALAAHVPIVYTASVVNYAAGRIDVALGATLGALLVAGTLTGMWLYARLSGRQLTVCVAWVLIAVGAWYAHATLARP
ncbi:MAG TPA: sulfite exporter TauE/SafE family protein [Rubrivivax sp.]|nr:sulfite exporter TauE/SafE family protein [Rubrivivax sp.]